MINSINPEYTLQALQQKYGITYKPVKPIFLTWDFTTRGFNADYIFVNTTPKKFTVFTGVLTMLVDITFAQHFSLTLTTPDISTTEKIQITSVSSTNPISITWQYEQEIIFNKLALAPITPAGTVKIAFQFMGFYFEQP